MAKGSVWNALDPEVHPPPPPPAPDLGPPPTLPPPAPVAMPAPPTVGDLEDDFIKSLITSATGQAANPDVISSTFYQYMGDLATFVLSEHFSS